MVVKPTDDQFMLLVLSLKVDYLLLKLGQLWDTLCVEIP